jgi:decaprenyl-phosphate phosphoribosyltransferase
MLAPYLHLMRPRQWIKNALIFAPVFFSGSLFIREALFEAALCAVAFSLFASAVYVVNDIADIDADRAHPTKKNRPLPRGAVPVTGAYVLALILLLAGAGLSLFLPAATPWFVLYLVLNGAYSFWLKHVAIVDITLVATFYVLRIAAGGAATSIELSPWIILATFFLALFLVVGKRRGEFGRNERRKSLDGYAPQMLDSLFIGSAVLAIGSYSLWSVLGHPSVYAVYTIVPVAAVLFRVTNQLLLHPEHGEAPEVMVFKDRWTLFFTLLWTLLVGLMFYVPLS